MELSNGLDIYSVCLALDRVRQILNGYWKAISSELLHLGMSLVSSICQMHASGTRSFVLCLSSTDGVLVESEELEMGEMSMINY